MIRVHTIHAAKIPYTTSPFLTKSSGPADRPWIRNPPNIIAVTPSPGIPSTRSGIIAPPMVALFADSVATIPSGLPLPNFSGCLDMFFAVT